MMTGILNPDDTYPKLRRVLLAAVPGLFVVLWSTGFVTAKLGLPYADPTSFLAMRFLAVTLLMFAVAHFTGARWPQTRREWLHIAAAGLLLQGGYLLGVFWSIHTGTPAGTVSVLTSLQPVLTAVFAGYLLGETTNRRQWLGLMLGFVGASLVVMNKLAPSASGWLGVGFALLALVSMTAGTLYQKRFCGSMDLRSGATIQFGISLLPVLACYSVSGAPKVHWNGELIFAMAWSVLVLSVGAITLLQMLIRAGEASKVSSLFYLVPPLTALIAWMVFGESLGPTALIGMVLAPIGVAMVNSKRTTRG